MCGVGVGGGGCVCVCVCEREGVRVKGCESVLCV